MKPLPIQLLISNASEAETLGRIEAEAAARGVAWARLPVDPKAAAFVLDSACRRGDDLPAMALWDPALGSPPWDLFERFLTSLDDAWHPGPRLSGPDEPDLLRYIEPTWPYRIDPDPNRAGAINGKFDPRALLLKTSVIGKLGGLDPSYMTLAGAVRALGFQWLRRGGVCRQQPALLPPGASPEPLAIDLADRYRLFHSRHGPRWGRYVMGRRILAGSAPIREYQAWHASATPVATPPPIGAAHRDTKSAELPPEIRVSVVLPTFGRYRYVAEVLDDLRRQSIPVTQILVADGNPAGGRQPDLYGRFADLPLEVLWIEQPGTCIARNACLARVTGDYVWFVDDDSRLESDNLENHLRVLLAYGADVSVGPARTPHRPELHSYQREIACTFMDCGTTLCRHATLEAVGGFDLQLNDYLPGEDGELGFRFVASGSLMLNNPLASRYHYLAPLGGCRTSGNNVHRWKRWALSPRPARSIYYSAARHFGHAAAWEATLLNWFLAGWRRPEGSPDRHSRAVRTLIAEALALPVSLLRLSLSLSAARQMLREGPQIPELTRLREVADSNTEADTDSGPASMTAHPEAIPAHSRTDSTGR